MTYRDNDVYFSLAGGYRLINGSYTINSFSITSGQDPDHHIYVGLTANCGSNGKMTFSIGRKGTSGVADWFNTHVPASQPTFNHTAGDLNFAFLGTLKLIITGGILGGGQDTFTFSNVALAQGHSGASNNWWFGGQNCSNIGNNQVIGQGVNSKGGNVSFVFLRGGNDVSTVGVTPTVLLDTANWMKQLSNSLTLNQLMMPGSHDAGMSETHHCNPFVGAGPYTQTQSGSVGQQLVNGSRYFDIRVDYDYNTLVTYHRSGAMGCNGQDLQAVLNEAQAFLQAHPSETSILKFSHIRDYGGHNPADTKRRINTMLDSYKSVIYTSSTSNINLAKITLGDVRGKMILVFDYSEYIDTTKGRFRYKDGHVAPSDANLTVYDEYSNTANYDTMKNDQLQKWQAYGRQGQDYLFLLSWTLTANTPVIDPSIEQLAAIANGNLPVVLYSQIVTTRYSKPNIVYIDYVNSTTCQSIIQYNY